MNHPDGPSSHRILIIDDNPSIHEDIRKILGSKGEHQAALQQTKALLLGDPIPEVEPARFEIDSAYQGQAGLAAVERAVAASQPYALAFVDVRMPPGWDGIETIAHIWQGQPDLQIVICTAYSDYLWSEMVAKLGKSDHLVILKKPFDNIEVLQLTHALTQKWRLGHQLQNRMQDLDQAVWQRTVELQSANEQLKQEIAERLQVEKALRSSETRFSKAFQASPIPLAIQSLREEKFLDANLGFQHLTGFSLPELTGRTPHELNLYGDPPQMRAVFAKLHQQPSVRSLPCRLTAKSGQGRDILLSVEWLELDAEPLLLLIAQDVTEQITLENQLRQAQKMEAVGQLAAGVAHDFNNVLTVVLGHASLLLAGQPRPPGDRKSIETIAAAAQRAGNLVKQLLAFSRKQFAKMSPTDMGHSLTSLSDMLLSVLPESIQLRINVPPGLPRISADAGMIEQMLMNLAINARDAMPQGGRLTISAEVVEVSAATAGANQEARPGQFLCLSVEDTGWGMTPDVLSHIFEPFFTTKPVGQGTGLGLATVYGIAKQHEAWVEVKSQPGLGTSFRIFLPVGGGKSAARPDKPALEPMRGGSETILVVEDEASVRELVGKVLQAHGYSTIVAESGFEALGLWEKHRGKIHLLLTDLVMPGGLMGRELGEKLSARDPALKVLYSSGYSPGMAGKDQTLFRSRNFLPKPYCPATLLEVVRGCLDGIGN